MPFPTIPFPHVPTIFAVVGFCVVTDTVGLIVTVVFGFDEVGLRVIEGFVVGFTDDSFDGMDVLGFDDVGANIVGLDDGVGGVVVLLKHGPF